MSLDEWGETEGLDLDDPATEAAWDEYMVDLRADHLIAAAEVTF